MPPLAIPEHDWTKLSHVPIARRIAAARGRRGGLRVVPHAIRRSGRFHPDRPPRRSRRGRRLPRRPIQGIASKEWDMNRSPIAGTPYLAKAMSFGLYEDGHAVPMDAGSTRQSLEEGCSPIVGGDWRRATYTIRQRATAEPLRGSYYETGLESTLAWAAFDIANRGKEPRDSPSSPPRPATTRILGGGSPIATAWCLKTAGPQCPSPRRLHHQFQAQPAATSAGGEGGRRDPKTLLRQGGLLQRTPGRRGRIEPGQTIRLAVNRVFDFPVCVRRPRRPRWPPRNSSAGRRNTPSTPPGQLGRR